MITFEYDDDGRLMVFKDGSFVGYMKTLADFVENN